MDYLFYLIRYLHVIIPESIINFIIFVICRLNLNNIIYSLALDKRNKNILLMVKQ